MSSAGGSVGSPRFLQRVGVVRTPRRANTAHIELFQSALTKEAQRRATWSQQTVSILDLLLTQKNAHVPLNRSMELETLLGLWGEPPALS